jgi:predicted phosphodiesterase
MRLAILSDIHGNLPALMAVIADVEGRSVDRVVNLGDCASGPLWPAETVALLRDLRWPTVRGNHDRLVGFSPDGALGRSDSFAWGSLDIEARDWLARLPPISVVEGALCMHGRMDEDEAYLLDEVVDGQVGPSSTQEIARRICGFDAPLMFCGHSHAQRHCMLPNGVTIVNPGSVGWQAYRSASPQQVYEAGSPHARYALVTIGAETPKVELIHIVYEWEAAARRAEANDRADWAYSIRTGLVP